MTAARPLPAFNFYVTLTETGAAALPGQAGSALVQAGFSEAQGLESEIQVEERRAGGQNDRVFRFPTTAAFPNIVLSRGVTASEELYLWHASFLMGTGRRRNGVVFLADEAGLPVKAWQFENGIPVKWSGPALNATTGAVAIEKLEIAHERLSLLMSPGLAGPAAAALGGGG